jgi:hypothetical protein
VIDLTLIVLTCAALIERIVEVKKGKKDNSVVAATLVQ